MQTDDILTLYEYNYWANARILEAAAKVSHQQFIAPGKMSHGGLRGTLAHTLLAEWIWRMRCHERVSPTSVFTEDEFPTLADLVTRWQAEEKQMRSFLSNLTDEDLPQIIDYTATGGRPQANILWQILAHVVNHGTQHRSEAAVLLTELGHSPGDLDLIVYLRP